MKTYSVTYTDFDAIYPAEKKTALIVANSSSELWEKVTRLGRVRQVFIAETYQCVISDAWDFNLVGLDQQILDTYWRLD